MFLRAIGFDISIFFTSGDLNSLISSWF